jgi:beta-lactam-binding protein with PASTA domain
MRVTGGSYPARIWQAFMASAMADAPVTDFIAPPPTTVTTLPGGGLYPPTPTTGAPVVVPDVLGAAQADATAVLAALGLQAHPVPGRVGPPAGTVTAMSPPPGTSVGTGGRVTLEIAQAQPSRVSVPAVIGLTAEEAADAILDVGLIVAFGYSDDPRDRTPSGRAWAQEPAAGSRVLPGSTVQVALQR